MSNFSRVTKHPITKKMQDAEWLDDYFGHHRYGVRFPDGYIWRADEHRWEFGDDLSADKETKNDNDTNRV